MSVTSWSRVNTFLECKYRYYLKYVLEYKELSDYKADDPFFLGTAMHEAIAGVKEWEENYYNKYFLIEEEHKEQVEKIKKRLPKVLELIPPGGLFEVELNDGLYKGYIDYLYDNKESTVNIYDFKYSDKDYSNDKQLSIYKFFYEKIFGKEVKNLYYVSISKKSEDVYLTKVEYDFRAVASFLTDTIKMITAKEYPKDASKCYFCRYKEFCNIKEV